MNTLLCRISMVGFIVMISCVEVPPVIDQPVVINTDRNVLVEEYTGVRCVNCPAGTSLLQSLATEYGDRLIPVSFHAGFFSKPYSESRETFVSEETERLQALLGEPIGYPAATVDRVVFEGKDTRVLISQEWGLRIQERLALQTPVAIDLNATRSGLSMTGNVQIQTQEELTDAHLTAYLVQGSVVDIQATPEGVDSNYVHKHVLRTFLTPVGGIKLEGLRPGNPESLNISSDIDPNWKADDLSVIAFVHENGAGLDVYQAVQIKL